MRLRAQGYETFESCFRSLAGRNLLPYSVEDTGEVVRWPTRKDRHDSEASSACMVTRPQQSLVWALTQVPLARRGGSAGVPVREQDRTKSRTVYSCRADAVAVAAAQTARR